MYNCRKCGHALPSNSALCPNCGTMMDSRQLAIKKSLNSPNSAYLETLEALKNKNIMLVICGSSMSFIEKELLSEKNPLYGRTTGIYKMLPMPFL